MQIEIDKATPEMASDIARLVMVAMNYECCQYFAGEEHTLDDFHDMLTDLVKRTDSQHSYKNTLVAVLTEDADGMKAGTVVGVCVAYDGAMLHELRQAFLDEEKKRFGLDFSDIADETKAGELYVDSLCVDERCRHQGVATNLLKTAKMQAMLKGIGKVGLLVDKGNPTVEKLYLNVGFRYVDDNEWGGHPMKHLVW